MTANSSIQEVDKLINEPLNFINETLDSTNGEFKLLKEKIDNLIVNQELLSKVPLIDLNKNEIPFGKVIKIRLMVQDTSIQPEVYINKYTLPNGNIKFNSYNDDDVILDESNGELGDRDIYFCTTVPGSNHPYDIITNNNEYVQTDSLKYPNSNELHLSFKLKVYGMDSNNPLCNVKDVIDCIGIIYKGDDDKILQLHCLSLFKVDNVYQNLFYQLLPSQLKNDLITFNDIVGFIASKLNGDISLAKLLTLQFITPINNVTQNDISSINLQLNNHIESKIIIDVIQSLLPVTNVYTLTLDNINSDQLIPKFIDSLDPLMEGQLNSGKLQLPNQSYLIIDETCSNEGTVNEHGLINLGHIDRLLIEKKLTYSYPYFQTLLPLNLKVLILSKTNTLLTPKLKLQISPKKEIDDVKDLDLKCYQQYLSNITLIKSYNLTPDLIELIQQDFVNMRKFYQQTYPNSDLSKGPNANDLEFLLILAKSLCIAQSIYQNDLKLELNHWHEAKQLYCRIIEKETEKVKAIKGEDEIINR